MTDMGWWFNGWEPIARIIVVGTLAYVSVVFLLRITKKRTLARLNAFDFIVTVAIGASFGRILTARHVALAEAFTAFALLVALQYLVSWLQVRSKRVEQIVTAAPTLLFYRGRYISEAMRQERITKEDLQQAARHTGVGSMDLVEAIVLECDGRFSVIKGSIAGDLSLTRGAKSTD